MELFYEFCSMERPRWCINRKDLNEFPVITHHFFNMFIKRRLVSAPSLSHNQAVIMQETEHTHKLKIIQQEISFASKYNKNNVKNVRQQQYKKTYKPRRCVKNYYFVTEEF